MSVDDEGGSDRTNAGIIREADPSLTSAVYNAIRYAMTETGYSSIAPTTLTVAIVAESLIEQGYPATLHRTPIDYTEGEV